jgi:hypothetical protein
MRKKSLLAVALCTAALAGASASAAFAGEVKGPPGTPSTEGPPPTDPIPPTSGPTHAPANANSVCAFSGLNDMIVGQGPTDTIVQTPGHFMLAGLTPPGIPGHGTGIEDFFEFGCRGGSN